MDETIREQSEQELSEAILLHLEQSQKLDYSKSGIATRMVKKRLRVLFMCWQFVQRCHAKGREVTSRERERLNERCNKTVGLIEAELPNLSVEVYPSIRKVLTWASFDGFCDEREFGKEVIDALSGIQSGSEVSDGKQSEQSIEVDEEEHWLNEESRILHWFGKEYPPLDRNPFEVVQLLHGAFKKGESCEWVSLEYMRDKLKDVRALDTGMAEVFKQRSTTKAKRKTVRNASKHPVWELIERRGGAGAYSYRLRRMNIPE